MTGNRQAIQKLLNDRQSFAHAQPSFLTGEVKPRKSMCTNIGDVVSLDNSG